MEGESITKGKTWPPFRVVADFIQMHETWSRHACNTALCLVRSPQPQGCLLRLWGCRKTGKQQPLGMVRSVSQTWPCNCISGGHHNKSQRVLRRAEWETPITRKGHWHTPPFVLWREWLGAGGCPSDLLFAGDLVGLNFVLHCDWYIRNCYSFLNT